MGDGIVSCHYFDTLFNIHSLPVHKCVAVDPYVHSLALTYKLVSTSVDLSHSLSHNIHYRL